MLITSSSSSGFVCLVFTVLTCHACRGFGGGNGGGTGGIGVGGVGGGGMFGAGAGVAGPFRNQGIAASAPLPAAEEKLKEVFDALSGSLEVENRMLQKASSDFQKLRESLNDLSNTLLRDHNIIMQAQQKLTETLTSMAAKRKEEEEAKKAAAEAASRTTTTKIPPIVPPIVRRKRHFR